MIESKLALPRVQPGMLRRPRLLEIVDGNAGAALTVVKRAGWLRQDDAAAVVVHRAL